MARLSLTFALAAGCILVSHAAMADAPATPPAPAASTPSSAPPSSASPSTTASVSPPASTSTSKTTFVPLPSSPPPIVRYESHWYGWQTLLADAGSIGLGFASKEVAVGALAYGLVPPIIHWSHGNVGRGFASLGIRLGGPVVGALVGLVIGTAIASNDHTQGFAAIGAQLDDELGGLVVGAGVGYLSAVVVDAAALSWDHDPVAEPSDQAPAAKPSTFTFTPRVSVLPKGGAQMGLGGSF
jgi:hypothetical protein